MKTRAKIERSAQQTHALGQQKAPLFVAGDAECYVSKL